MSYDFDGSQFLTGHPNIGILNEIVHISASVDKKKAIFVEIIRYHYFQKILTSQENSLLHTYWITMTKKIHWIYLNHDEFKFN